MRFTKRYRRVKINKKIIVVIILIVGMIFFDALLQPIIFTVSKSAAVAGANASINTAVADYISSKDETYDKLVEVSKSNNGEVTLVETNAMEINNLKSQLALEIENKLRSKQASEIKVALGTIIGGELLTGRGPNIKAKTELAGNVYTTLNSVFEDAGINQTHHKIILNVECKVNIIMFGYKTSTVVETEFLIAETVIVGNVPQAYTSVETLSDDLLYKMNDYQAISQK